jgi:hypothetical protein
MTKKIKHQLFSGILISSCFLMTSCATIIGGSRYNAHITVKDRTNATITYKNGLVGKGTASIKVPRREANQFYLEIKEEGCKTQIDSFTTRSFRGWALVGTLIGWTGVTTTGIPLPWGLGVDLATGALWKPNVSEKGITKLDLKNYNYLINYKGCDSK